MGRLPGGPGQHSITVPEMAPRHPRNTHVDYLAQYIADRIMVAAIRVISRRLGEAGLDVAYREAERICELCKQEAEAHIDDALQAARLSKTISDKHGASTFIAAISAIGASAAYRWMEERQS